MRKGYVYTPKVIVQRRYPEAVAEACADGMWRVYARPGTGVRHCLGKGTTGAAAWVDAATRCASR